MQKTIIISAMLAMAVASQASSTIATFSDPSSGSPFLFDWDQGNNTLTGSWTGSGLTMQTPGFIGGGSVTDAHFLMSTVTLTTVIPNVLYTMSSGQVQFYTNDINNPFYTVTFGSGNFLNPLSTAAASSNGNAVSFSGPNVPGGLTNQAFAFSLANPTVGQGHITYTASFTSSADVVPEPASILAIGAGIAAFIRRRKA